MEPEEYTAWLESNLNGPMRTTTQVEFLLALYTDEGAYMQMTRNLLLWRQF